MAEVVSEKSTEREGDGARTTRRGSAEVLQRFFISKVAGVQTRFDKKEEGSFALILVGGVVSSYSPLLSFCQYVNLLFFVLTGAVQ